ncbi:hypothetical protein ACFTY8_37970 [Streptomyces mirabilis]|uniref:hypothetical protein n=1 Tax=Streptomyces mirabilis TaxID=68239 RepID=UPI003634709A
MEEFQGLLGLDAHAAAEVLAVGGERRVHPYAAAAQPLLEGPDVGTEVGEVVRDGQGTGLAFSVTGPGMPVAFTAGGSVLLMLSGAGLCRVTINTGTVRLLATPSAYRNRMVAAASFLSGLVMPLGSISSGLISRASGERWALLILGGAICACAAIAARDKAITRFLDMPDEQLDDAYLREFPHAFDAPATRMEKAAQA